MKRVYLIYDDTSFGKSPFKSETFDIDFIHEDKIKMMSNLENYRENLGIKISKTNMKRPKSASEVMIKISNEVMLKKSVSLSNIEEFFLKRRIPLIKPLISEREIIKLQLLQQRCKMRRNKSHKSSWPNVDTDKDSKIFEGVDLQLEEDKPKDKTAFETLPLLNENIKSKEDEVKPTFKKPKEIEESGIKSPAGKTIKQQKKDLKENTKNKSKPSSKKEKEGTSNKEKVKTKKSLKSQRTSLTSKAKTSLKNKLKTVKSPTKEEKSKASKNHKLKPLTSKNEDEESSRHDSKQKDSSKNSSKSSSRKASKHKLPSELSAKDPSKKSSEHSRDHKDHSSRKKKSDTSDKSDRDKSVKKKPSSENRNKKEKSKSVQEDDLKDQIGSTLSQGKIKPQSEDSQKSKDGSDVNAAKSKSGVPKSDKKAKPETSSETFSDINGKETPHKLISDEKSHKTSGKIVKFPNVFEHIIHYVLSNPLFIKLGWTLTPSDQAQLQLVTFKTTPSTPHSYCFRERTEDETKYYTPEKVAYQFRTDGTGEIFYPSGALAAGITNHSTGKHLTLYCDPGNDPLIKDSFKRKVLGIFDSFGNGVVYDMQGKKLLNFNQLEGIFCSPQRKSNYKWQWYDYKILDKHRIKALLRYMAKEQKQAIPAKKVTGPVKVKKTKSVEPEPEVDEVYEQILAELPHAFPQKSRKKGDHQCKVSQNWGFKPITFKINKEMIMRINGQDDVSVSFSTNKIFLRIDLGVKVDPEVVVRIEELSPKSVSEVPCVFDGLLNLSPSLQRLYAGSAKSSLKDKHSLK